MAARSRSSKQRPRQAPAKAVAAVAVNEAATRRELERIGELHSARGQAVLTLAQLLDRVSSADRVTAASAMAASSMVKEIRTTLKELTPDDGGDDFARFMAELSSPVRDASQ